MVNIRILLSTIFVDKVVNNCFMSRKNNGYFECFKKMLKLSQFWPINKIRKYYSRIPSNPASYIHCSSGYFFLAYP